MPTEISCLDKFITKLRLKCLAITIAKTATEDIIEAEMALAGAGPVSYTHLTLPTILRV